ncbi:MAG: hypothetical protein S4CHLAM123_14570 [Chlamydiales bacterium]|nr:hypothetical protein [Chlamydiales bacterium]
MDLSSSANGPIDSPSDGLPSKTLRSQQEDLFRGYSRRGTHRSSQTLRNLSSEGHGSLRGTKP